MTYKYIYFFKYDFFFLGIFPTIAIQRNQLPVSTPKELRGGQARDTVHAHLQFFRYRGTQLTCTSHFTRHFRAHHCAHVALQQRNAVGRDNTHVHLSFLRYRWTPSTSVLISKTNLPGSLLWLRNVSSSKIRWVKYHFIRGLRGQNIITNRRSSWFPAPWKP